MASEQDKRKGRFTVKFNTDSYASKIGLKWAQLPKNFTQLPPPDPTQPSATIQPAIVVNVVQQATDGAGTFTLLNANDVDTSQSRIFTLTVAHALRGWINSNFSTGTGVQDNVPEKVFDLEDFNLMLSAASQDLRASGVFDNDLNDDDQSQFLIQLEQDEEKQVFTLVSRQALPLSADVQPNEFYVGRVSVYLFFYRLGVDDPASGAPSLSDWTENERLQLQNLACQIYGCEPDYFENELVPAAYNPINRSSAQYPLGVLPPGYTGTGPLFFVGYTLPSRGTDLVTNTYEPVVTNPATTMEMREVRNYATIYPTESRPPFLLLHCSLMENAWIKPTILAYPQQNHTAMIGGGGSAYNTFNTGFKDQGSHTALAAIPLDWGAGNWDTMLQVFREQDYLFDVDRARFNEITFWFTTPENHPVVFNFLKPVVCLKVID